MWIILMILDIMSLIGISLVKFHVVIPVVATILPAFYLISKGFIFKDFMSIVDSIVGIYFIVSFFFGGVFLIYFLVLGWFLYKLFLPIILSK